MEWSKTNVYSSRFTFAGVPRQGCTITMESPNIRWMAKRSSACFHRKSFAPLNPLMRGFDEVFYAPHSRHTTIKKEEVAKHKDLRILVESKESGIHIIANEDGRQIFILGHQEYDKETLGIEYFRDIDKGLDIEVPKHYFQDDDPTKEPIFRWRSHASLLFTNWLNYYVYQATPYDLDRL